MALLGPAPAAFLGLASALVDALRRRVRGTYLLNNLLTYTTFPLLGGIVAAARSTAPDSEQGGYARRGVRRLPGRQRAQLPDDRRPHADPARRLAAGDVPHGVHPGAAVGDRLGGDDRDGGLRLRGLSAPGSSACSRSRSASTSCCCARCSRARRTRRRSSAGPTSSTSATRGCSGCCWRRSRCAIRAPRATPPPSPTTRTSSRARPGLSEREQAIVHTAGLVHDLGKEALPDHILIGRSELHPAERRLIERHPADGARLLLRVEGMGEVAAAVLAHHERIDGRGLSRTGCPATASR